MRVGDECPAPALECRKLSKAYGSARIVLAQLDFMLDPGEFVAIMGESGVGKSTLLNLIAGLDAPDGGSIVLDGTDLATLDDTARTLLRRDRVGFVFQAFHLLPHLTVMRNIMLPLALSGTDPDKSSKMTGEMLE